MKKTKILKKNYEYKNVLSKGNYYSGKNLEIFINKNNKEINFIGIAISSKIAKAVVRNRIKRLIRENYKNIELDLKTGYNIVFLWKKNVSTKFATYENIKLDIKYIFDKANILEENI